MDEESRSSSPSLTSSEEAGFPEVTVRGEDFLDDGRETGCENKETGRFDDTGRDDDADG